MGAWLAVTVKLPVPLAVPPAVVTLTAPVVAPGITIATKLVPVLLMGIADTPPIVKPVGLDKFVPVMVTKLPTLPDVGVKELMVGGYCGLFLITDTLLSLKLDTAKSGLPSPSKSPIATA